MYFKPYLWLTLLSVPALALLLFLGSWQVQRLFWKTDLISTFTERAAASPISVSELVGSSKDNQFRRLSLSGTFLHDDEVYLVGRTYEGNAGFHVVTPLRQKDDSIIFINRGWVSEDYRLPAQRPFSLTTGEVQIDGIIRLPQQQGYFVPDNEPERGFWFTLKPDEIARFRDYSSVETDYYVDQVRTSDVITLPISAEVRVDVRNAHLNYALTWFGVALSLIGVYIAYHVSAGRLGFRSKK